MRVDYETVRSNFEHVPVVSDGDLLAETAFFKWLEEEKEQSFIVAVKDFLGLYGFDIARHLITTEESNDLRHVFTQFWYLETRN